MKALTLWQPWASAIAYGMKHYETRSWSTQYRGPLAIHAASRKPPAMVRELLSRHPFPFGAIVPLGAIVATCQLVDVWTISSSTARGLNACELAFGDWTPGRFMWVLIGVERLACPISMPGARGLWDLPIAGHDPSTAIKHPVEPARGLWSRDRRENQSAQAEEP